MKRFGFTFATLAVMGSIAGASAGTVNVDFDPVAIPPGTSLDATSYLNTFGIGFVALSNGATPLIFNASSGFVFSPSSSPNVFAANGTLGNAPLSYELTFSQPLLSFSFVRVAEVSSSSAPPYTVSALDSVGNVISSIGEGSQLGTPARAFTLNGPGIFAIRMDANNSVASTLTDPPLDSFVLVTATPEPSPMALLLAGCSLFWAKRCTGSWT